MISAPNTVCPECFYNIFIVRKGSKQKNLCIWKFFKDCFGSIEAVHSLHADIDKKNIRSVFLVKQACLGSVSSSSHDFNIRICLKNGFQCSDNQTVLDSYENTRNTIQKIMQKNPLMDAKTMEKLLSSQSMVKEVSLGGEDECSSFMH